MIMMLYVIHYFSVLFCFFLYFFITLPSQWYTFFIFLFFLPPYLHSDDEDHERYDGFPSTFMKTKME